MENNVKHNVNRNRPHGLPVERLNNGEPIIAPTENWWETGVTFNPAAYYVDRSPENEPVIRALLPMRAMDDPDLSDGVVAVYYRARPERDPGSKFGRSFIGLAVFTPGLKLLYRYQEPVIYPSPDSSDYDSLGVEDPRIHRFGSQFIMIYCGVTPDPVHGWKARLCMAKSNDLIHWIKLGIVQGDPSRFNNKDGVLFPDCIDGKYYLLHRPFMEEWGHEKYTIRLAESSTITGPWVDVGETLRAFPNVQVRTSWVGAGSVPVKIAEKRYLELYHIGNYLNETDREYDTGAAIYDFNSENVLRPESLVCARLEPLMVPETPAELRSRSQHQVGNVLFACGSYVYEGWLYIIYGGADTYTLAARVRFDELIQRVEKAGLVNPYTIED